MCTDVKPCVSIITPCYNGEKTIERLMDSILEQTYDNIEFILVNDGSTDQTECIIKRYDEKFKNRRIKFIHILQKNKGLGGAINAGLSVFSGSYFCWPDADDYLERESIERRVNFMETHPEYAVVTSNAYVRDYNNLDCYRYLIGDKIEHCAEENQFELLLHGKSIFCSGCHMVRTKQFLEVNPEKRIYPARRGQNWQLLLPLYYKYKRFYLDISLYNYLIYPNSMSKDEDCLESKLERYREHERIIKESLNLIEKIQKEDMKKYEIDIDMKYSRMRLELSIRYKSKELFRKEYSRKKSLYGRQKGDLILQLRGRFMFLDGFFRKMRRLILECK